MGLHRLFPGRHTLRTVPVALAPVLIGSVCFLGSDLSVWVFFHHLVNEAGNLIAVPPILGRSFPDSARCIKPGLLQQPQPIQAPVEDAAQVLRLPQPPFQGLVLLFLGEVPVERTTFTRPESNTVGSVTFGKWLVLMNNLNCGTNSKEFSLRKRALMVSRPVRVFTKLADRTICFPGSEILTTRAPASLAMSSVGALLLVLSFCAMVSASLPAHSRPLGPCMSPSGSPCRSGLWPHRV